MVKESFEDLMMGNVSENVSEDNEAFDERLREVQAKLAQIAKDEGASKNFDESLAVIVKDLSHDLIRFVAFLLDHEIPSLTVLASISIASKKSRKVVQKEFERFLDEPGADFKDVGFSNSEVQDSFSLWWTLMIFSDHHTKTVRFQDIEEKQFHEDLWETLQQMAHAFLGGIEDLEYNKSVYDKKMKQYFAMFYKKG